MALVDWTLHMTARKLGSAVTIAGILLCGATLTNSRQLLLASRFDPCLQLPCLVASAISPSAREPEPSSSLTLAHLNRGPIQSRFRALVA